jgi:MinD-like ATPase involved in chromosome partitioning or flagellar assembly
MQEKQIHFIDASIGGNQELPLALLNYHDFIMKLTNTPESIRQTFGIIKLLSKSAENRVFGMIVSAQNEIAAQTIYRNLKQASKRFSHIQLELIGFSTLNNNWVSPIFLSIVPAQIKKTIFITPFGVATN